MSDEINNQKVNKSKKIRHRIKHYTMLTYITIPLIFVLISMVVVLPASVIGMKVAVNAVHKAQEVMVKDFNDVEPDLIFEGSTVNSGTVKMPQLYPAQKIAVLTCENAGLKTDVYSGINRVSMRYGVGLDGEASAFGQGGTVNLYGNKSTYFDALDNVGVGDKITVEASWGLFEYEVTGITVSTSAPNSTASETLYLASSKDNSAFSNYDAEKLFIAAKLVSGPAVEEVQYE